MDQNNHHKIPLNPPFAPTPTGIKRPKGEVFNLPLEKGGGEGF